MVENSLIWLMVSYKFEYMFELLLIIYLVPVIIVLSLLLRLVLWLARNVLRFAFFYGRGCCCWSVSSWDGVVPTVRQIKDGSETAKPHLSRTGRYGFVLYSDGKVFFPHVRCLV